MFFFQKLILAFSICNLPFLLVSQNNYYHGDTLFVWAKSGLNVRDDADLTSNKIGVIPYGKQVVIVEQTDIFFSSEVIKSITYKNEETLSFSLEDWWVKVKHEDVEGYVFGGYLSSLPPIKFIEMKGDKYAENIEVWLERELEVLEKIKPDKLRLQNGDYYKNTKIYGGGVVLVNEGSVGWYRCQVILPNVSFNEAFLLIDALGRITEKCSDEEMNGSERVGIEKAGQNHFRYNAEMGYGEVLQLGSVVILTFFGSC